MIVHGFLQAGGGSTRFGSDKALASVAGKTMLQRTGELLGAACHDVTIVAPAGKYGDAAFPVLADRWPGEGPLGGILTALLHLNNASVASGDSAALILSCDMPFLTKEFLLYLRERAACTSALIVAPQSSGGLEPLCACWNARCAGAVQLAFDSGVRKVAEAMKRLPQFASTRESGLTFFIHVSVLANLRVSTSKFFEMTTFGLCLAGLP
jgi:molybdopterin-guanine dinucleotide biosynthesis protein A